MGAHCDVAVIGAGPAGCAAAMALKRLGVGSVLLIEATDGNRRRFGESLPPDTRLVLAQLGIDKAFDELGCDPCVGSASSWGADTLGFNDFLFNPHGLGWHVDRSQFDAFMRRQAVASGAELRLDTVFEAASAQDPGLRLRIRSAGRSADTLDARFVVDATGQAARVARAMGADRLAGDRLVCAAALLPIDPDGLLGQRSLLEAVEHGWWYAARIGPGEAIVLIATDADILHDRRLHEAQSWRRDLAKTRHVASALGHETEHLPDLVIRQARSSRLNRASGPGWLAIGDAASAYDPLSSQGMHKAMTDGLYAARQIHHDLTLHAPEAIDRGADLEARFASYLRLRDGFYAQETRWSAAPFWRRRQVQATNGLLATPLMEAHA